GHIPVLLSELLSLLDPRDGETYVDLTAGLGGHAAALAPALGATGTVVLFDLDPGNLERAVAAVRAANPHCGVEAHHASFAAAPRLLRETGRAADLMLADLGFSSNQMGSAERGLSFQQDGPLDMRLDPTGPTTAADLVNELSQGELADLIRRFGEERYAGRIARILVEERKRRPIQTTARLAELVRRAYGKHAGRQRIDPATRTFQALRIAVNDELGHLTALLDELARSVSREGTARWLRPGARIALIAFHSLEDRLGKRAFAELAARQVAELLTRRPVSAEASEVAGNPRARSAKLRAVRLSAASGCSPQTV
ncbi:MAG: 16S rRNA (cytosine(1402)-N(4))-methyltransferase RsmH, partial [Phycisphaerales bacterium JB038]